MSLISALANIHLNTYNYDDAISALEKSNLLDEDVKKQYPIYAITNPHKQKKYKTINSFPFIIWSFIQLNISVILMFHFFTIIHIQSMTLNYIYGALIILHIFSFTSALDRKKYSISIESSKIFIILGLIYQQDFLWFNLQGPYVYLLIVYSIISITLIYYFYNKSKFQIAQ